jgi:hypothetical protein
VERTKGWRQPRTQNPFFAVDQLKTEVSREIGRIEIAVRCESQPITVLLPTRLTISWLRPS